MEWGVRDSDKYDESIRYLYSGLSISMVTNLKTAETTYKHTHIDTVVVHWLHLFTRHLVFRLSFLFTLLNLFISSSLLTV